MKTDEPFLIPMTLLTASCLAAMIYGCGGCVADAADLDRSETVSTSDTDGSETSDLSFDTGETEAGEAFDMRPQSAPEIPPTGEACTTIVDGCCWCMPTGEPVVIDLTRSGHIGISGQTRMGKSSLLMTIVREILKKDAIVLLWDKKRELRQMAAACRGAAPCLVFRWAEWMLAPLDPPPGVPVSAWDVEFVDLLSRNYSLYASRRLLYGALGAYRAAVPRREKR